MEQEALQACPNQFLEVTNCWNYCPNRLQVEGRAENRALVSGATASLARSDSAVAASRRTSRDAR